MGEIVIRRPVEIVFDTLGDPRQERTYNDRVQAAEMLTPGPIAEGSRFEQQVRRVGRTDRATVDITGFQRPSRLALMINPAAMVTSGDLQLEEVPAGTHATYAWDMQVWWVNRRTGLAAGVTMAELAADYAEGISRWFVGPIDVLGVSTGGSVALQLAADHPDVVCRLVLVSSACRLAPHARHSSASWPDTLLRVTFDAPASR
jgi:pimeloyl-ACP methyl ester carboxylesterase